MRIAIHFSTALTATTATFLTFATFMAFIILDGDDDFAAIADIKTLAFSV
ncbi:MAG: hypothetical protein LCI00_06770 [Chloroflexi bacterium]|nr:hypothetical protein [Chloroflexota bacterium]MCC6891705.1 hypothetical protein [Anaerolineae bacterium]